MDALLQHASSPSPGERSAKQRQRLCCAPTAALLLLQTSSMVKIQVSAQCVEGRRHVARVCLIVFSCNAVIVAQLPRFAPWNLTSNVSTRRQTMGPEGNVAADFGSLFGPFMAVVHSVPALRAQTASRQKLDSNLATVV